MLEKKINLNADPEAGVPMDSEVFAEWLRRQGHSVVRTPSSYWYEASPRVYQSFPYYCLIDPDEKELMDVLREKHAVALRYSTSMVKPTGRLSYHVIYDKPDYPLSSVPRQARQHVKQGLKYATYESIPLKRMSTEGWECRYQTLVRQGRQRAEKKAFWERMCLCAEGLPGFEAWGAIHNGELVAALLAHTIDDTVTMLFQQSKTEHLRFGVNHGLTYVFTRDVLRRPGMRLLFYGLHSLDAPSSVDEFKFRMGYLPKPVRQRIVFNPFIQPFVNRFSHGFLKAASSIRPNSPTIGKAEGVFQFYLQGRRPISKQEWPKALQEQEDSILALSGGTLKSQEFRRWGD